MSRRAEIPHYLRYSLNNFEQFTHTKNPLKAIFPGKVFRMLYTYFRKNVQIKYHQVGNPYFIKCVINVEQFY